MDTSEKLIAIDEIVRTNKLDVCRGFSSDRLVNAFGDAEEVVADEAIDKIYELCLLGVNGGFTREVRAGIETLSGVVVNLTARNLNTKKLNNLKGQVDNVKISDKRANKQPEVNPQADIKRYIITTIGAIDAMLENQEMFGTSIEVQKDNMLALRAKLEQLQAVLDKVRNSSSKQAAKKAFEIVKELAYIRVQLSGLYCSREVISHMDVALDVADEWAHLSEATDRRNLATINEFPPECGNDTITVMSNSVQVLSDFKLFCLRFEEELEKVQNPEYVKAMQEKLTEVDKRMGELKAEGIMLKREAQNNGETSQMRLRMQQITDELKALMRDKESIRAQIDEFKNINEYRKDIFNVFKTKVYDRLMSLKMTKPMQLCGIIGELDMGRILRVISADCTQQDLEAAQRAFVVAETQYKHQVQALNDVVTKMGVVAEVTEKNMVTMNRDARILNEQQRTQTKETNPFDEFDALFEEDDGNTITTPNQNTTEQKKETNTSQILHLTGDDN